MHAPMHVSACTHASVYGHKRQDDDAFLDRSKIRKSPHGLWSHSACLITHFACFRQMFAHAFKISLISSDITHLSNFGTFLTFRTSVSCIKDVYLIYLTFHSSTLKLWRLMTKAQRARMLEPWSLCKALCRGLVHGVRDSGPSPSDC